MIEIAVRHGPFTFRVQEDDLKSAISRISTLQEMPTECPRCGAPLRLTHRVVTSGKSTYNYYGLTCLGDDPHATDFGAYQDDERQLFYDAKRPWRTRAEIAAERENGH